MPIGRNDKIRRIEPEKGELYSNVQQYSEAYKESCFFQWYNAGCPRGQGILNVLTPDEYGRKPALLKIWEWRRDNGWIQRAAEMDKEAKVLAVRQSIQKRAQMFQRAAEIGEELQERGVDYLEKFGIDSANTAIKAIIEGHKMEKSALGGAEFLTEINTMSDDDLTKRMMILLNKSEYLQSSNDEVVDGEYSEE